MQPLRLCLLTTAFPRWPGDYAGQAVSCLVKALDDLGCSGCVIVPHDQDESNEINFSNFHISRFPYGLVRRGQLAFGPGIVAKLRARPLLLGQLPLLLWGFLREAIRHGHSSDVVVSNWVGAALAVRIGARLINKPQVIVLRREDVRLLQWWFWRVVFSSVLRQAAALIVTLPEEEDKLRATCPSLTKLVKYIPKGIDQLEFTEQELRRCAASKGLSLGHPFLITCGELGPLQHLEILVQLLNQGRGKGYELIVCGEPFDRCYLAKCKDLAKQLGCSSRIHFTGPVPEREVAQLLALSKYYVSAADLQHHPWEVFQACAAGKPLLLARTPAHCALADASNAVVLFDPRSPIDLANRLEALQSEPGLEEDLIRHAKKFVGGYTWEHAATSFVEELGKIVSPAMGA